MGINAQKLLAGKLLGKQPLGRMRSCKDNIKMELRKCVQELKMDGNGPRSQY
jgi:hypothetical protein